MQHCLLDHNWQSRLHGANAFFSVLLKIRQHVLGHVDHLFLVVAQYGHLLSQQHVVELTGVEHVVQFMSVGLEDDVTVGKSGLLHRVAEGHTLGDVSKPNDLFALGINNARVDDHREQQVEQHATQHNEQALPGGLAAEFPRLGRLLHGLGVHRLVNHARDSAIATEWNPADAIFRRAPRVFILVRVAVFHGAHFLTP